MKRPFATIAVMALMAATLFSQTVGTTGCYDDHWNEICHLNQMSLLGNPYFSCATGGWENGVQYCCKYTVQNHTCEYPPPAIGKFFDYIGAEHTGACNSNSEGQWCPSMSPPNPPGGS